MFYDSILYLFTNSMTSSSLLKLKNFVHIGRFERCKTPMGTVPISVIMGFDYPLDPYQVQMVSDGLEFMKKQKGDGVKKKQTRYI